ncbi:hypothetical protein B0H65DRAFT_437071 [Neurospora tetraspora]|uniref:Uncharacterized protein n=1 Tax=Neurospora tetraspora TaxID=94610 RepID=A0AAE0J1U3_9PEZI|nr:hypothetical protein B0H65DRAFT_437071 [Neurospora tetraspora]
MLKAVEVVGFEQDVVTVLASGVDAPVCSNLRVLSHPIWAPGTWAPVADAKILAPVLAKTFPAGPAGSATRAKPVATAAVSLPGCNSFDKSGLARLRRRIFHVVPAFAGPLGLSKGGKVTAWLFAHPLMCVRDNGGRGWEG